MSSGILGARGLGLTHRAPGWWGQLGAHIIWVSVGLYGVGKCRWHLCDQWSMSPLEFQANRGALPSQVGGVWSLNEVSKWVRT